MRSLKKTVIVREVWKENLREEFDLIHQALIQYPYASMDTEFSNIVVCSNVNRNLPSHLQSSQNYYFMKLNVDLLKIIQLGLTLFDAEGNLPDFETNYCYIWEFNFRDFDIDADHYNPDSIELLKRQRIDFWRNKQEGIDCVAFALMLIGYGLVFKRSPLTWVTFHSAYDFGFLIKVITNKELPDDLTEFMGLVSSYFGMTIYDMKHMIKYCNGLYGGLDRVAKTLDVDRVAGKSHQAGSDSLLTM